MFQPRLRTRNPSSVETSARKPSHLTSNDHPEPEGTGPGRDNIGSGSRRVSDWFVPSRAAASKSGLRKHLECQRSVAAEWVRYDDRPTSRTRLWFRFFEVGGVAVVTAYAPQRSASSDESPYRELPTRGPIFDVAVWEPKDQDRRRRDEDTLLLLATQAVRLDRGNGVDGRRRGWIDTLDVQGRNGAPRDTRDRPHRAPAANRVADRRCGAVSHVVLVVPVGEHDDERPCLYGPPRRSIYPACPSWSGVNAPRFEHRR